MNFFIYFKMPLYTHIHISEENFYISVVRHIGKRFSITELFDQIKYLLDKGFVLNLKQRLDFLVTVYVRNQLDDSKRDKSRFEKKYIKPFKKIKNLTKTRNWFRNYRGNYSRMTVNMHYLEFDAIELNNICFGENSIKINNLLLEKLLLGDIYIELDEENYDKIDFDSLIEIKIYIIKFLPCPDRIKYIKNFINNYKSYCRIKYPIDQEVYSRCKLRYNTLRRSKEDEGKCPSLSDILIEGFVIIPNELFYYSGSMIEYDDNLNYVWRKNLFILTCCILFENHFRDDLLANPMAMMKIVKHLNQK